MKYQNTKMLHRKLRWTKQPNDYIFNYCKLWKEVFLEVCVYVCVCMYVCVCVYNVGGV